MIIDCFSYKIFKSNINILHKQKLIDIIENLETNPIIDNVNSEVVHAKMIDVFENDVRFYDRNNDINLVDDLCHQIEKELNLFSKKTHFNKDLEISYLWFISYKKTDHTTPHTHVNEKNPCFSGIYYLSFDNDEHQATTFYNDESLSQSFTPECNEGDLLIYPTGVWHGYDGIVSSSKRIIVAFDVKVKSKIKYY